MLPNSSSNKERAFTLIELLIVIAVIAIISIVVVLILNPAQLLMQGRDADRLSDMSSLKTTVGVYTSQGGASMGSANTIYISIPDPSATSSVGDQCQGLGLEGLPIGYTYHCASTSTIRSADGTGWIPIPLNTISGGSPLGQLPIDPINQTSSSLFYTYETNGSTYEVTADLESQTYQAKESGDGGQYSDLFEAGSNLALAPADFSSLSIFVTESNNLTSSRTIGGIYQNTSGEVMFVSVENSANSGTGMTWALTGSSNPPTSESAEFTNNTGYGRDLFFPVPPGDYYEVAADGASTISGWYEWTVSSIALGQPSNLTSTRALATIYHNTSGNPLFLSVASHPPTNGTMWILDGTSSPPTTETSAESTVGGYEQPVFGLVPNNQYYEVSYDTSPTLDQWYEWSLANAPVTQSANLTASRILKTVYQNTSTYPLLVSADDHAGSAGTTWALVGSTSTPGNEVASISASGAVFGRDLIFLVPPNYYYEVSYDTGSSLDEWYEWTIQ